MEKEGFEVQFVNGQRYTDQRTLNVVEHVLCNEINKAIVDQINELGSIAMGLHTLSSGVLFAEKMFVVIKTSGIVERAGKAQREK